MSTTPTPRTDAMRINVAATNTALISMTDFARQLERELTSMTDQRDAAMRAMEWNKASNERELAKVREQRDRLAEALKMWKADGPESGACFCDAQFAMHGAHPSHSDECKAATEALAAVKGGSHE